MATKLKCKIGKNCGQICIPKKYECSINFNTSKKLKSRKQIKLKSPINTNKKVAITSGIGVALLGGGLLAAGVAGGGAAAIGVEKVEEKINRIKTVLVQLRDEYRAGFKESAKIAVQKAKYTKVPNIPADTKKVLWSVGGFGSEDALSESQLLSKNIRGLGIKDKIHTEDVEYSDFNVATRIEETDLFDPTKAVENSTKILKAGTQAMALLLDTVTNKKYNPVSRRIAAQAIAFKKKYPNIDLIAVGHSGGGYVVGEWEAIMREAGYKVKAISIGTPDVGIFESEKANFKTAVTKQDGILNATTKKGVNQVSFDEVQGHGQDKYFSSEKFKNFLRKEISGAARNDSARFDKKQKCVKGKQCGDICIPKDYKCQKIKKPASAKKIALAGGVGALGATAALAGVSTASMISLRSQYRSNIPSVAKEAEELSKKIDLKSLPDMRGKKGYALLMPGFSGHMGATQQKHIEAAFGKGFNKNLGGEFASYTLSNTKYNLGKDIPDYVPENFNPKDLTTYSRVPGAAKKAVENLLGLLVESAQEKKNKQSVDSTAYLLAMEKKFNLQNPGVEPKRMAIGYSAGGIILSDSNMHLNSLKKKPVDMLFFGSPYLGFTDETNNIVKINSKNDSTVGNFPRGKSIDFDEITNHVAYQENQKVQEVIKTFINNGAASTNAKYLNAREDSVARTDRKIRCLKGKPCGDICIPKKNECQVGKSIPTKEAANNYTINPDTGEEYTIRELKQEARKNNIYRYSDLTKPELQQALVLASKPEEQQQKIAKSVISKSSPSQKAINLGLRGPESRKVRQGTTEAFRTFKNLESLSKFANTQTIQWGVAATAMFLTGTTLRTFEKLKGEYRGNFKDGAKQAAEKALTISPPRVQKRNLTFIVGTDEDEANTMVNSLNKLSESGRIEDKFLTSEEQHFVKFPLKEANYKETGNSIVDAVNLLNVYARNLRRGKDQDAVDLAAQIYAYGIQRVKTNPNKLKNKSKNINILAGRLPGQTSRLALEYLQRIEVKGQPSGKEILEQINLVNLGSPHFGFTENVSKRQRTLISAQDPTSALPVWGSEGRPQWVSTVKGGNVKDYLSDERSLQAIRESFGFYDDSATQLERKKRKDSAQTPVYSSSKGIKCGNSWISKGEQCSVKKNKNNVAKFQAKLGRGAIGGTIGGTVSDLERAYIKTHRLATKTKNNILKKQISRVEKIQEEIGFQAAQIAITLGKGHANNAIKKADLLLIGVKENIEQLPSEIKKIYEKSVATIKEQVFKAKKNASKQQGQVPIKTV